ncbi:hypothetical protein [Vallicoccus soli]|uniref:hypothetical protein n=1 Tax=Vallicoccus soli TaxID=2339232 RepID=UPI001059EB07|nr:hypothetical protein [Vallicoccus soli]
MALLLGALVLRSTTQDTYDWVVDEDGPVEWATVLVYLAAALLAVTAVRRMHRAQQRFAVVVWSLLGAAFVGVAVEEVSWGQRALGFDGPQALVQRNRQQEANLHNLLRRPYLHGAYIAVGVYGAGVGRSLLRRIPWTRSRCWYLAPGPQAGWCFGVLAAVYLYYELGEPVAESLIGPHADSLALGLSRLQEVGELCLALGFLLFALAAAREARCRAQRDAPRPMPEASGRPRG